MAKFSKAYAGHRVYVNVKSFRSITKTKQVEINKIFQQASSPRSSTGRWLVPCVTADGLQQPVESWGYTFPVPAPSQILVASPTTSSMSISRWVVVLNWIFYYYSK